ncbi:hypothetical protein A3K93_03840 [Acinetobacter sp. NCu2D-2]|uniref:hypothetical protein n=1 Tax=Acinetobacter sp. NCu2D-2 TaxID=1608473 RepID=UPI0007CDE1E5|nr:hypothetical protein [Acinetobacter sp. NCu2D-2]ANF81410.1 hypothetical protein A3K93_03840 [Acinetobacter sp. NCu2D-2]
MLEELQRLHVHIGALKTRLAQFESENLELRQERDSSVEKHEAQIAQKNNVIEQKQQENTVLTEQLTDSRAQFQQLNQDATALADRYSRLEKSCTDLKNRFQEILAERNDLRALKEKLLNEQQLAKQEIQRLNQENERLAQKNEHAKAKVEAIIQRLAILGTAQDQHAQEIQQLAHPSEMTEEASS